MAGVIDRDLGYNAMMRNLERLDGMEVVAGVLKDAGNTSKGVSFVDIATWNEYGTRRIPSRPFIRISADTNRKAWEKLAKSCVNSVIDGASPHEAGEVVGRKMVEDIQKVFGDKSKLAPNAPSTIKKKGHDKPLIDTGELRKRVNFRVEG